MAAKKATAKQDTQQNIPLEESFAKIDLQIEKLNDPETSLEDAFAAYEEGIRLVKQCTQSIDLVEKKVQMLTEESGLVLFDNESDDVYEDDEEDL